MSTPKVLIGINSFDLFAVTKFIEVEKHLCSYDTFFAIDKSIRKTVEKFPRATWDQLEAGLVEDGFYFPLLPSGSTIFWHPRNWDEHLVESARSYFVTFVDYMDDDLTKDVLIATSFPALFALVPECVINSKKLVLINSEHEAIFPDDEIVDIFDPSQKVPIGQVVLFKNQFPSQATYDAAKQDLIDSGYMVFNPESQALP